MVNRINIDWLSDDVLFNDDYKIDELIDSFTAIAYYVAKNLKIDKSHVTVNRWGVFAALQRYSRDIFGFSRLKYCLEKNGINNSTIEKIMNEVKHEHKGIGLRIVSEQPYFHKRIAFFIYYFSIIKPFSINYNHGTINELDEKKVEKIIHFNSIVLLSCIQIILLSYKNKNDDRYKFIDPEYTYIQDLIHELTYRSINRSSIESAMRYLITSISKEEYEKQLKKYKQQNTEPAK